MNLRKAIISAGVLTGTGLISIYLTSCGSRLAEGMILFTRVPAEQAESLEGEIIHHYPGAQIVVIHPDRPGRSETILSSEFYSACSPFLSYDARRILFTAQQKEDDPWQVWEMDLKNGTSKQITDFNESCSRPAYLPGDRLVFSRQMPDEGFGSAWALFTMNLDGTDLNRITFQPHLDYPATILRDGRVLMLSRQLYPEAGDLMYLAMRPNGTKAELFYHGTESSMLSSQAYETLDGYVYFIERENGKDHNADLVSVYQNRPLYSKINHTSELSGSFYSVFPLLSGDLLVSYRSPEAKTAGLYYFSVNEKSAGRQIVDYADYHALEPVLVEAYTRPRHLPDEVNKMESTGQLFCQDINVTAIKQDNSTDLEKATMVEVLGLDESMGIVPVEEDGSFYLKVLADTPFRIQTLDDMGRVVNGPSGWLWLRPFERRGCVGCHEDPELVPKNFVPLAVKKQPVSIPVEGTQETKLGSAVNKTE
ncbi:MAG: hypothetical protein AMS26_24360 [Bacteroides sp. SM23_62]|nr:MAG: hypothetical protein AMS26_24360 [Bacteroides sp. SM23_62]